jgi:PAS domain-containing protein
MGRGSDANGTAAARATPAPSTTRERERQQVFEFTRRKRWADILISEVPDSILLILNPRRTVLYCGPAVVELLGWQPENMVDHDFLSFVNGASLRTPLSLYLDSHR